MDKRTNPNCPLCHGYGMIVKDEFQKQAPACPLCHKEEEKMLKQVKNPTPGLRLDIAAFSKLSAERAETGFKTYRNVPITYWTTALMGEGGELCNMLKKMERVAHGGIDGGSTYTAASLKKEDLAEEIAGIFIYLNLLAGLLDIDMEDAIIETFNSKSKKYGFPQFYPSTPKVDQSLMKAQNDLGDMIERALEISKERDDMRQYLEKLQGLLFGDRTYAAEVEEIKELLAQYPKQ